MSADGIQKIQFDGVVSLPGNSVSRFSVAGSFREVDFTDLHLEIFWHGENPERQRALGSFMANRMNHAWILNENPAAGHLELLGLRGYSNEYSEGRPTLTRPQFSALQKGIHRDPETEDRKLHLNVSLVPSGLFENGLVERSYTGEIKVIPFPAFQPILVKSRYGEFLVGDAFEYEDVIELGNKVTKQISKSTITGEITVPKGQSLHEVNEKIRDELEGIIKALSLSYRQPVRYAQIIYRDLEDKRHSKAYYRRKLQEMKPKREGDAFINTQNLGNGGLQRIVDALASTPESADLGRAIDFLATSYESTLENAFFMAFSATETVINIVVGNLKDVGYSNAQWKVLKRAIKEAIAITANELSLDEADLNEKLPELKRLSFRKRVKLACDALSPRTDDLWPGREFIEGISDAAKLRNGLFHSAEYSDAANLVDSLIRIRTFTERLIAKLIQWPDEELWVWRDQELKFLGPPPRPKDSQSEEDADQIPEAFR